MKERITILGLIMKSKGKPEEIKLLYNLIKKHPYFQGERRKLYKTLILYKRFK